MLQIKSTVFPTTKIIYDARRFMIIIHYDNIACTCVSVHSVTKEFVSLHVLC